MSMKDWWDGLLFVDPDDMEPLHFAEAEADALIAQLNPGTAVKEPDGLGGFVVRMKSA